MTAAVSTRETGIRLAVRRITDVCEFVDQLDLEAHEVRLVASVPVPEVHDGRARVAREPLLEAMSRLAPTPRGPEAA